MLRFVLAIFLKGDIFYCYSDDLDDTRKGQDGRIVSSNGVCDSGTANFYAGEEPTQGALYSEHNALGGAVPTHSLWPKCDSFSWTHYRPRKSAPHRS